ncbi:Eukaryotic peptide chain release factor GTP-binding subunit [Binucleata daphniae]
MSHTLLVTNTFYILQYENNTYTQFFILFLLAVSTLALYKLSVDNPGYITTDDEELKKKDIDTNIPKFVSKNKQNLLLLGKNASVRVHNNIREILVDGDYFEEKFCEDCCTFTNNLVTHCYYCQCCVLNRDHHCIWLDTCITRYNMKKFLWLLNSTTIMVYYNLKNSRYMFYIEDVYFYCVSCVFAVMLLLILYFWLLFIGNMKSSEFIKRQKCFKFDIKRNLIMLFGNDIQTFK